MRFANSLKLRLAMRISNVSPDAERYAEEAVAHLRRDRIERGQRLIRRLPDQRPESAPLAGRGITATCMRRPRSSPT
ncbi:MAG: SusD/RagB family nutrient-binding outer membrane lipoprotein [Alistipes sp.]